MVTDDQLIHKLSPHISVNISQHNTHWFLQRYIKGEYRLGKFILGKVIGCGKSSEVRLASADQKVVAIKLLKRTTLDERALDCMVQEVQALVDLRMCLQPHITQIQEVVVDNRYVGLVMNFVYRGDLLHHIARYGIASEERVRSWIAPLVFAVDEMHSQCYVHRDIKLENLLLDEDGNLLLTDFEECRNFRRQGFPMMEPTCGSAIYCPPEALRNNELYDGCKADIWALGITIYACAAGHFPFSDYKYHGISSENIAQVFKHIETTNLSFPLWFSRDLCDLLERMLDKDPNLRASIVDVKAHRWIQHHHYKWHRPDSYSSDSRPDSVVSLESLKTLNDSLVDCTKSIRGPIIWDPYAGCDCNYTYNVA